MGMGTQYQLEDTAPEANFESLATTSGRVGSNKRASSEASLSSSEQHGEPVSKKIKTTRSRKRVNTSVKKERKREQNKTAALRYRQKKKEEKVECDSQQQELEEKNEKLKDTLRSLEAEISYLKCFWAEVQQAKRLQGTLAL